MIVEAVVTLALGVLDLLLGLVDALLPDWTPVDLGSLVDTVLAGLPVEVGEMLRWTNQYFPLAEVLSLMSVLAGVWAVMHLYRVGVWVLSWVRGGGGD